MSTLKVTNIQDTAGGNSSTSAEIYSGRAKVWVNFNGTGTVAIRASFNVSSITDLGTGDYRVNFTTAMPDTNYATVTGTNEGLNYPFSPIVRSTLTSSYVNIGLRQNTSPPDFDSNIVCVAIFR